MLGVEPRSVQGRYVTLQGKEETVQEPDGTIKVHGHGVAAAVPDGIGFRLTLSATHALSDEALQDVIARSDRHDAVLTELGLPHAARSTSGVSIRERPST